MIQSNIITSKKDVVIITCFAANEPRAEYVKEFFEKRGRSTLIISTDFIHRGKYYREDVPEGYRLIETRSYKKNLSIARLRSHYVFAETALTVVAEYKPELLYVMIPANALGYFSVKYKKQSKCKLVLDIIDLWPESLPIPVPKNIWPLSAWKALRDQNLKYADVIITECNLYQKKLHLKDLGVPVHTVYWPQKDYGIPHKILESKGTYNFLYLGSINNIIDINGIVELLCGIQKQYPAELHIVGDGEKREYFVKALKKKGIPVNFHGFVYDHEMLNQIASCCHMGINLMKSSVQVGLTMKSVTYFEMGLPIINNLKGDTWELIEQYQAGINIGESEQDIEKMFDSKGLVPMGQQARKLFEELFSQSAFETQFEAAIFKLQEDFDL